MDATEDYEAYRRGLDEVGSDERNRWYRFRGYYMDLFNPAPGSRILDLGAYLGANLLHYHEAGHEVVGVEGSAACVADYMQRTSDMDPRPLMVHGLIEEFQALTRFDAVICGEILEHVLDVRAVLDKAHECLRPGGALFIATPVKAAGSDIRTVSQEDLKRWLPAAGFDLQVVYHVAAPPVRGCADQLVAGALSVESPL